MKKKTENIILKLRVRNKYLCFNKSDFQSYKLKFVRKDKYNLVFGVNRISRKPIVYKPNQTIWYLIFYKEKSDQNPE